MFYKVNATLNFADEDEANDFYHDCEVAIAKSVTANSYTDTEERGHIEIHQCFHDLNPLKPCLLLKEQQTAN